MNIKLYKFRPLANQTDFDWAKAILETSRFWCSKFSELNDPMEGVFYGPVNVIYGIYIKKCRYRICSFSGEKSFENPSMWGYYANGFKGMVIEIAVDKEKVRKIKYDDKIANLENLTDGDRIEKILTTKSTAWEHEAEHRFLIKSENNCHCHKVGSIAVVYFGDPYGNVENKSTIYKVNPALKDYDKLKEKLMKVADGKKIDWSSVSVKDGKVAEDKNLPHSRPRNENEAER